jgi:hypothetical protein
MTGHGRKCRLCGKRPGSNANRCIACWDWCADRNLGKWLRRHGRNGDFLAAAMYFLERYGPLLISR